MYHSSKIIVRASLYLFLIALAFLPLDVYAQTSNISEPGSVPVLPHGKWDKSPPAKLILYQYDNNPLGRREPLLLVHGLKAEYWPCLRWQKLVEHLTASQEFSDKYKIFFVRYDSYASLDKIVPQLQAAIDKLYSLSGQKPLTLLALSMGGNIVYEAMLKPETNKQVKVFMAMGVPFHGTPLFSADWMQYGIYKRLRQPITRIDHSLAYKIYFSNKSNLLNCLGWDNCDQSIPDIGHFASWLPFGPKGDLTESKSTNQELVAVNKQDFDKRKIIAYSGFLTNPYRLPTTQRWVQETIMLPYDLLTITVPAHCGLEHPVLKMLDRQITAIATNQSAAKRAGTDYVYYLNDGITPVVSALFLPNKYCSETKLSGAADLASIKPLLDVHTARVFRNIDHLTYLDGYRPIALPAVMCDELNPQDGKRDIFDWILFDLDCIKAAQVSSIATYN